MIEKELDKEQRGQEYYNRLADKLDGLQKVKNDGRGFSVVCTLITYLRKGDISHAKAVAWNESDKINDSLGIYRDIKNVLIKELFDDEPEHPWSIEEKFKKRLKE